MRKALAVVFTVLLLIGSACAGSYLLDFHEQQQEQEMKITDLRRRAELPAITDIALPSLPEMPKLSEHLHDFAELQTENPDCIGWVSIPGTDVDFPVMQSKGEPEFYLKHDFEKDYNIYGLPFLDARCALDSDNLMIYGHHMNDGSMFSCLHSYEDAEFLDAHREVVFETPAGVEYYRVEAVLKAKGSYKDGEWSIFQCINFDDEMRKGLSAQAGIEVSQNDKLLTLVTCEYSQMNGRLAVIAVKE